MCVLSRRYPHTHPTLRAQLLKVIFQVLSLNMPSHGARLPAHVHFPHSTCQFTAMLSYVWLLSVYPQ